MPRRGGQADGRGCTGRGRTKQEPTRSGPSLRRGKGTLTLEARSRRKPSRDTTRRPINPHRNFLLQERPNESLAPTLMNYEQHLDFVQNSMKVSHICQPVIHPALIRVSRRCSTREADRSILLQV